MRESHGWDSVGPNLGHDPTAGNLIESRALLGDRKGGTKTDAPPPQLIDFLKDAHFTKGKNARKTPASQQCRPLFDYPLSNCFRHPPLVEYDS